MRALIGTLAEHRGTGARGTVRSVENWPDGRTRCVWIVEADGQVFDIAIGCWRQFWAPVGKPSRRAR